MSADQNLARGLGWLSLGLGALEVAAPRRLATFLGLEKKDGLLRLLGVREIAAGLGIFAQPRPTTALWARVGGDVIDLALLLAALPASTRRGRILSSIAAVGGVTALDAIAADRFTRSSARGAAPDDGSVEMVDSVAVNASPADAYAYWRRLEKLPSFMKNLQRSRRPASAARTGSRRRPAGATVSGTPRSPTTEPGELHRWRSLPRRDVPNSGTVRFRPRPAAAAPSSRWSCATTRRLGGAGDAGREAVRRGARAAGEGRSAALQADARDRRDPDDAEGQSSGRASAPSPASTGAIARRVRVMKATAGSASSDVRVEDVPDPEILNPRDAIVKITSHRDLRLGPAPLQRLHPDHEAGRHPRPRVHGRGRRGRAAASSNLAVGDRVVVPFPIACGNCFFCAAQLFSLCENSNPNAWMAEKMWGHSPAGIFGYSHMLGGYAGGQARVRARAVRRRRPVKMPDELDRRAGAVPLRHPADRLHGRRELRHPAGRHGRGLGLRPGRPVRDRERVPARRRARDRDRPLPRAAAHGARAAGAETLNYEDVDVSRRCAR